MKVLMRSHLTDWDNAVGGIGEIVKAYFKHLPNYGIELVNRDANTYDLLAVHAGMMDVKNINGPLVSHIHGLYWTAYMMSEGWEWHANKSVIESIRRADEVTVPSEWVADVIRRDMRFNPTVIPHGIDLDLWEHDEPEEPYILAFGKNRNSDVCDPSFLKDLGGRIGDLTMLTTFKPPGASGNVKEIGVLPHEDMKRVIQRSMAVVSPIQETFGILTLEAFAAGKPVVGFDNGGNRDLIEHGKNGYLAEPNNIDDLIEGILYCLKHRKVLGKNALETAKDYQWENIVEGVANVYKKAVSPNPPTVGVVVPCYNYADKLENAVQSILDQTYPVDEIVIVNDGSTDNIASVAMALSEKHKKINFISQENGGVAKARNTGIRELDTKYAMCLDPDDKIQPEYIRACVTELEKDKGLGIAYTGLWTVTPKGESQSKWPGKFNPNNQLMAADRRNMRGKMNEIPTAAVFRREAWKRVGGYNSRYCPLGAGAEDAEFWAQITAAGWNAKKATDAPLFVYSYLTGQVSGNRDTVAHELLQPAWLMYKPWAVDGLHPFASMASPSNKVSHPVRHYDDADVSIIIPVGEGHEEIVRYAIESVEGQTHRNWELIVVWDSPNDIPQWFDGYPYIKTIGTNPGVGKAGAGYARNLGRQYATSSLLTFLDADDELHPEFLEITLEAYSEAEGQPIVYTDYINKVSTTPEDIEQNFDPNTVLSYYKETGEGLIKGKAASFDCELAQSQETDTNNKRLFHWCLVTCLIPAPLFDEIGGFDESMTTFEDVLLHWSFAKIGACYNHVKEPLVMYRLYTGNRRELGSQDTQAGVDTARKNLAYAREKLGELEMGNCKKCPDGKAPINQKIDPLGNVTNTRAAQVDPNELVDIIYEHPNTGVHPVVGRGTSHSYGYHGGGDRFKVYRADQEVQPHLFRIVTPQVNKTSQPRGVPEPPTQIITPDRKLSIVSEQSPEAIQERIMVNPSSKPVDVEIEHTEDQTIIELAKDREPVQFDINEFPGVNPAIANILLANEIMLPEHIVQYSIPELVALGIDETRADLILSAAQSYRPPHVDMAVSDKLTEEMNRMRKVTIGEQGVDAPGSMTGKE